MTYPKVVRGMPAAEYHSGPEIGSTGLRTLLRSPAHFAAEYIENRIREETKALRLGTYTHTATLEPERWAKTHVAAPKVDRRTKEGKARWEAFNTEHAGKTVVDADEHALAAAMAASVRKHPAASHLLRLVNEVETSIFWEDDVTGVICRDRPDALTSGGVVLELKTAEDASEEGFARSIATWDLHVQMAHHEAAFRAGFGQGPEALVWIVVEKAYPHVVATYAIEPATLEEGRAQRTRALDLLVNCREAKRFPGYGDTIKVLGLPAYAFRRSA
jgi:hypothetical protein